MDFLDLLFPEGSGAAALVGAGGKTSIMNRTSREAALRKSSLVLTVSTKLQRPAPVDADRIYCGADALGPRPGNGERVLWVGEPVFGGKKWSGPALSAIEGLVAARPEYPILVEADGAACRSVKAPGGGEPVIPAGTDTVAAVIGLSALGCPIGEDLVHRLDSFLAITDARIGEPLGPEHLVRLIVHPRGSFKDCPDSARKIVVLNQADAAGEGAVGEECAVQSAQECAADKTAGEGAAERIKEGLISAGFAGVTLALSSIGHNPPIWSIVEL